MVSDLLYLAKQQNDPVHYDNIVVRVMAADVLDMDNSGELQIFVRTLVAGGITKIVVDMMGLDFIDSAGIGVLIDAAKHLRQKQGDLVFVHVPEPIQVILQPVKLSRFIKMFNTIDEVKNFFRHV